MAERVTRDDDAVTGDRTHEAAASTPAQVGSEELQAVLAQRGADPQAVGELIQQRPEARRTIYALLQKTLGNHFVSQVLQFDRPSAEGGVNESNVVFSGSTEELPAQKVVAKPLLGGAGTDATPEKPRDESMIENDVIYASLQAAQFWLETGAKELGGKADAALAESTLRHVNRHLNEARTTIERAGNVDKKRLQPQMDQTSDAMIDFLEHAVMSSDSGVSEGTHLDPIVASNRALRAHLGLADVPKERSQGKAKHSKDHYEGKAIGPVLELAEIEASRLYARLMASSEARDVILQDELMPLGTHLSQAVYLLGSYEGKDEASAFSGQVEKTSGVISEIDTWIESRQNNIETKSLFRSTVQKTDQLRKHVGLGPLSKMPTPPLQKGEKVEADNEQSAVVAAEKKLWAAMTTAFSGFSEGADQFFKFSTLERPPAPTSFWSELAKGILVSVIGNLAGPAMGALISKIAKKVGQTVSNETLDFVQGTTVDSVQAIAGKIADGAIGKVESKNQEIRDRWLFKQGLIGMQASMDEAAKNSVTARVQNKSISANELLAMTDAINETKDQMAALSFQKASQGFALLTAQQKTGTRTGMGGKQVSDLDKFFDSQGAHDAVLDETRRGRTVQEFHEGKEHSSGIAKLTMEVFDHDIAGTQIKKFEINGLNDDMAIAVLQNADYNLAKIGLPLDIHITSSWEPLGTGSRYSARLVADETGTLQTSKGWPDFSRGPKGGQSVNADFYSTPEKLWDAIRNSPIPKDAAKIAKGG